MRKTVLTTIAGAALIAGSGLAAAQMENSPGRTKGAQGASQREPGRTAHERQPGAMQGPAEGRSTSIGEGGQRSGLSGTVQGQTQGRSSASEEEGKRSGHPGTMQGPAQQRSGAVEEKEHRSRHSRAEQRQDQGRSGAVEEKERRSGHPGAMQGQAQGRSSTEQSRGGITEQRSVASPTLSQDQKTRLHEVVTGDNVQHVNHVGFALSPGIRVPDTVSLYDVPNTIVEILPQYRGFEYIVVRDELVIIDPDTLDIVAVLPV
jgi:Protein of unknown function (DUF1236)